MLVVKVLIFISKSADGRVWNLSPLLDHFLQKKKIWHVCVHSMNADFIQIHWPILQISPHFCFVLERLCVV